MSGKIHWCVPTLDDYGREGNEKYENLYPTREEVLGIANDDSEEDSDD